MSQAAESVLDLAAIRAADAGRVGPKMARLGQLAADGWRVPDGYAVTAAALGDWLPAAARAELERLVGDASADLPQTAGRARELVESQPLPGWLADTVADAHERLAGRTGRGAALRVAVRSSAVSEDGQGASFAGQYDTYLGVTGVSDVLTHVRKCWASCLSAHALAYRRRFGAGPPVPGDLAVGVLELVDARSAGVAFTLDPVTGDRSALVVEGNWGFGESVVSGQVTPDHWRVDRATGRVLTARVGAKRTWAAPGPDGGPVAMGPLPDELAGRACLSEDEVRYICEQAARIEATAGGVPQDIEWAVAHGLPFPNSVFFLQHRPETTWTGDTAAAPAAPELEPESDASPQPAFDPVQYALRNVFKVPGTASPPPSPRPASPPPSPRPASPPPPWAGEVAIAAARAGGAVLTRHLRDGGDLGVAYKDARANLVTVADTESQRAVAAVIRDAFPAHAVVGEEGTAAGTDDRFTWYVDPLDGTTNYAHGVPFFCVSVALRADGRTVAGAVYDPLRDEMYAATAGGGTTLNGFPLRVSGVGRLDRALLVAQAQTVVPAEIRAYGALVERLMSVCGGVRSLGSPALTLCAIAAGRLEAYCEYTMDPWDILAGQLIVSEAGGKLTLFDGQPHDTADRADVVASNGHVHDELIAALRDL